MGVHRRTAKQFLLVLLLSSSLLFIILMLGGCSYGVVLKGWVCSGQGGRSEYKEVNSEDQRPDTLIEHAILQLGRPDGELSFRTYVTEDGSVDFDLDYGISLDFGISPRLEYRLRAYARGYEPLDTIVRLSSGHVTYCRIVLVPQKMEDMEYRHLSTEDKDRFIALVGSLLLEWRRQLNAALEWGPTFGWLPQKIDYALEDIRSVHNEVASGRRAFYFLPQAIEAGSVLLQWSLTHYYSSTKQWAPLCNEMLGDMNEIVSTIEPREASRKE